MPLSLRCPCTASTLKFKGVINWEEIRSLPHYEVGCRRQDICITSPSTGAYMVVMAAATAADPFLPPVACLCLSGSVRRRNVLRALELLPMIFSFSSTATAIQVFHWLSLLVL